METDTFLTPPRALSVLKENFFLLYLNYQLCSPNPCKTSASQTSVSSCCHTSVPIWKASPSKDRNNAGLVAQSPPGLNKERYNRFSQTLGGNLESGARWAKFAPAFYLSAHIHLHKHASWEFYRM